MMIPFGIEAIINITALAMPLINIAVDPNGKDKSHISTTTQQLH